eukprot:4362964-Lingulodinium_polyedra.AAC.1
MSISTWLPKSAARLWIPMASAIPRTAAYNSASMLDNSIQCCVLAHALIKWRPAHTAPPEVLALVPLSPAQSESV